MQFIDLARQQEILKESIRQRIETVLKHGQYIMGPEVTELESQLCKLTGNKHCISCSSGTDALLMALMAYGIGPGDAVFTTPFTFIATSEVISLLGATPVFVDIQLNTFNMDPECLAVAIRDCRLKAKAIIPVDLFGLPANYPKINEVAREHGLIVIQDAAQSLGSIQDHRHIGHAADCAATSFFPSKPLGCYGDGGAIFTNSSSVAETLRSIRVHGKGQDKYDNVRIGLNGRLDTLQAAVLLSKLEVFEDEILKRQSIAHLYNQGLGQAVITPTVPAGDTSAWAQYSILTPNRESLQLHLKNQGIPTMIYYPKPLHLQTAYNHLGYKAGDFPCSERVSREIVSLPMHPYLESETQNQIVDAVKSHKA